MKKPVIIALSVFLSLCLIVTILTGGFQKGIISGKIYRPANVFEEIWNLVLEEQHGKSKTVLTTGTMDAEVDFDVGFFQNIQIPEHRLAIGWEAEGKALFFLFSVRLGGDGEHIRFIYDYKSKSLSGNTPVSYLKENFLSPYFDWCEADGGFSSGFSIDAFGNCAFHPTYQESSSSSVYWNLDRAQYSHTISTNISVAAGRMDLVLTILDAASIMDVRPDSEAPGQPITLELLDEISIYCDMEGVVTAVFLRKRYNPETDLEVTDFSYEKDASDFLPGTPGVVTSNFVNTTE